MQYEVLKLSFIATTVYNNELQPAFFLMLFFG